MRQDLAYIETTIRQGLCEGLSDREIGARLLMSQSTANHWRRYFGLDPADKFMRKFRAKYGPDAVERFRALVDAGTSYREIGLCFGFSHEYARQVYRKLYNRQHRGMRQDLAHIETTIRQGHHKRYPTDLTDTEWTIVAPLIPAAKPVGRPRTTDMRQVVNAIFYVLRGGCQWRLLPKEFPPYPTVYDYFWRWRRAGVWEQIHDTLRGALREASGCTREPSEGILDSQTVRHWFRLMQINMC